MEKIQLKIIGFFQAFPADKTCFIVLQEVEGERKLVVRVGVSETDAILTSVENIKPRVPSIHDLFFTLAKVVGIEIKEILLESQSDNTFHGKIIFLQGREEIAIETRISDAIALAVRFRTPVSILEQVLENTMELASAENLRTMGAEMIHPEKSNLHSLQYDELKSLMQDAIDRENYELAGKIRDELLHRNKPGENKPGNSAEAN